MFEFFPVPTIAGLAGSQVNSFFNGSKEKPVDLNSILNLQEDVEVFVTASGRSAIRAVLLYLKGRGDLKEDQTVLISPWVCISVYQTIQREARLTLRNNTTTSAVLLYHQFGFPQKMEEIQGLCKSMGMTIIEDSVNVIDADPEKYGLGKYSLCSIHSFSKMSDAFLGGALATRDERLSAYMTGYLGSGGDYPGVRLACYGSLVLKTLFSKIFFKRSLSRFQEAMQFVTDLSRNPYRFSLETMGADIRKRSKEKRRENHGILKSALKGTGCLKGLPEDVTPSVLPIFGRKEFLSRAGEGLRAAGFNTHEYHFDIQRNMFNPHWVKCIPVPLHRQIPAGKIEKAGRIIRDAWSATS